MAAGSVLIGEGPCPLQRAACEVGCPIRTDRGIDPGACVIPGIVLDQVAEVSGNAVDVSEHRGAVRRV